MTISKHYRCIYISDHVVHCVHRLGLHGGMLQWNVNDEPAYFSANKSHNLLVACDVAHRIQGRIQKVELGESRGSGGRRSSSGVQGQSCGLGPVPEPSGLGLERFGLDNNTDMIRV